MNCRCFLVYLSIMRSWKVQYVIHLFALLHAGVALGCRLTGLSDSLILTLLTMLLAAIICFRRQMGLPFLAITIILVNIAGFLLGKGTAALFALMFSSPLVVFPLSTFASTEIIGWCIFALTGVKRWQNDPRSDTFTSGRLRWALFAFMLIVLIRLGLILVYSKGRETGSTAAEILLDYFFTLAVVIFLSEYAIRLQSRAQAASEEANLAQFRYMKLKQQVNPHFLFNSLNVLDCMIQEQSAQDASRYTHKLAEIYRYMIKNEDETTVKLRDEMEFVGLYIDLLKVRFPEGLEVRTDIPEEHLSRSVVPCSVQLLIENATKHNAVQKDNPLVIDIHTTDRSVVVTNNLCPKLTKPSSTGLGLQYIRQQYKDIAHKSIQVRESDGNYTVILPLI